MNLWKMVTKVKKYGGSVLKCIRGFESVVEDIEHELTQGNNILPVVSAPGAFNGGKKMTDRLIEIYNGVGNGEDIDMEWSIFNADFNELFKYSPSSQKVLHEMRHFLELSQKHISTEDIFIGSGESISAAVLKDILYKKLNLSFQNLAGYEAGIKLNENGEVLIEDSLRGVKPVINPKNRIILEGYTGAFYGHAKLMERNGTDVTAALAAYSLHEQGEDVELWILKDNPVTKADPRIVEDPKYLKKMSYGEASLMAWGGTEVVHPDAIKIASMSSPPIPIFVGNFEDQQEHTKIHDKSETTQEYPLATVTAAEMFLLDIRDERMAGISGYYKKVLDALSDPFKKYNISIDYSNSVPDEIIMLLNRNIDNLDNLLKVKLESFGITNPEITYGQVGVVSVVGEAMKNRVGTLESLSRALADNEININTTFQGRRSTNIAFCVALSDLEKAVHAIYEISLKRNLGED